MADGGGLDVYRQIAPLNPSRVARLPEWTRDAHELLSGVDLDPGQPPLAGRQASVASLTARLNRLRHGPPRATDGPTPHTHAPGR